MKRRLGEEKDRKMWQGHAARHKVTQGHAGARRVTQGHAWSRMVVQGHASGRDRYEERNRIDKDRIEEEEDEGWRSEIKDDKSSYFYA